MIRPPLLVWLIILPLLWASAPMPQAQAQAARKPRKPSAPADPTGGPTLGTSQRSPLFPSSSAPRGYDSTRPTPMPRSTAPLPFNLMWGDSRQKLASLFAGVGARITEKKPSADSGETWTVQGLIAPGLQASMFTFQQDILCALEFDYGDLNWDTAKYNDIMGQLRRRLEGLYGGPGEMVSRKTEQEPNTAIKQTFMGYQWLLGDTLVQLFYFAAEEKEKSLTYRTISVHYHYQDPATVTTTPDINGPAAGQPPGAPPADGGGPTVSVPSAAQPMPTPPPSKSTKPGDDLALPEN